MARLMDDKVLSISHVTNEHLMFEITNGQEGVEIGTRSIVYDDAGESRMIGNQTPIYLCLMHFNSSQA